VKAGLVPGGVAVYGHWHGPRHPESVFHQPSKPFIRHGWIVLPDGQVCDPTRWVFEHVAPYIYIGPSDHYDEGGNAIRTVMKGRPPRFDRDEKRYTITKAMLPSAAWSFIEKLMGLADDYDEIEPGTIDVRQLFWLANQYPRLLGEHAPAIYKMLDRLELDAAVPFDNRKMVERLFPGS